MIAQHIGEIEVGKGGPRSIVLDEESLGQLKLLGLDDTPVAPGEPRTAAEVMDTIQKRVEARLADHPSNARYRSLPSAWGASLFVLRTAQNGPEMVLKPSGATISSRIWRPSRG